MDFTEKELKNLQALLKNKSAVKNLHPGEIVKIMRNIHRNLEEEFMEYFNALPEEMMGHILLELPQSQKDIVIEKLSSEKLKNVVDELESDDAADLMQSIEEQDSHKAQVVLGKLSKHDRDELKKLKAYNENLTGAFMQTEIFDIEYDEKLLSAINRFRILKRDGELENVSQAFIIDKEEKYIGSIRLEDLILFDVEKSLKDILNDYSGDPNKIITVSVKDSDDIHKTVKVFQDYDISSLAVVDEGGVLVGRITSDDIYDIIQDSATKQIYNLAGVGHGPDMGENEGSRWSYRAIWLFVNLCTMLLASSVIGMFEETIQKYVALAVLMPIIPALSGNAGIQALTVTVRGIALGEVTIRNAKKNLISELKIASLHGAVFSVAVGGIAAFWFGDARLGCTMGLSVITALFAAGFLGAFVPVALKRIGVDPAVGSSVVITGIIDSLSFFTLFTLATLIML